MLFTPAAGEARRARATIAAYKHLSAEQKAKLLAAVDAREAAEGRGGRQLGPQELRTEVVEELMSITDGQVVLKQQRDTGGWVGGCRWVGGRVAGRAARAWVGVSMARV